MSDKIVNEKSNNDEILIEVKNLKKYFNTKKGLLHAVDDLSFYIKRRNSRSCRKAAVENQLPGRAILRLHEPTSGEIIMDKENTLTYKSKSDMRKMRQKCKIVFQDPYSCLIPV